MTLGRSVSHFNEIISRRESTVQRKKPPTTFYNRKHLKGWAKTPIPKQIEGEQIDKKRNIINVLGKLKGKSNGAPPRWEGYVLTITRLIFIFRATEF